MNTLIIACAYAFMNSPTVNVEVALDNDLRPGPTVQVSIQGSSHPESATPEVLAADELVHLWISKENPEGGIEMIVYKTRQPEGDSKLVNHSVPFGKVMWGRCSGLP